MQSIQHIVLRNFWSMALEKPTREKPVREREGVLLILQEKIRQSFYSQNTTYLDPAGCLVFRANAASISVLASSRKQCRNDSKSQSSISVQEWQNSALENCSKTAAKPYCTDSIKCFCTASKNVHVALGSMLFLSLKTVPEFLPRKLCQNPYCTDNNKCSRLDFCACKKWRPYSPSRNLCQQ